jgi:hypothetical protein
MIGANRATILRQDEPYLQTDRSEHPLEPSHLGVPSDASKKRSNPMVRLVQTMHLSYMDTNIVTKQAETRFHMADVT